MHKDKSAKSSCEKGYTLNYREGVTKLRSKQGGECKEFKCADKLQVKMNHVHSAEEPFSRNF